MSVLIYIELAEDGRPKKSSLEALTYGNKVAQLTGVEAHGVVLSPAITDLGTLGQYGIKHIYQVSDETLAHFDAQVFTHVIAQVVAEIGATTLVFCNNTDGKALAPRLSARLKAGLVAGAVALPDIQNGFVVRKSVFSGKAFADIRIVTAVKIISINANAFAIEAGEGTATVIPFQAIVETPKVKVKEIKKQTGEISLSEAEIVVSGGRGMKGPENWGILEELAKVLHAALACSRPVADAHWRPHNEHVGQTGGAVAPNLYIACGISGAIQHLAGVNRSKVIVVINKDPDAPFFKAADYGVVGDLFDVVPKLTEEIKKLAN